MTGQNGEKLPLILISSNCNAKYKPIIVRKRVETQ
jgi:hypothetical protein